MASSTVAGLFVREPSSCLTVVMVRWPVLVMALLRWQIALQGTSGCAYRSCSWAMRCCLWMCHCCRSTLMWAIRVLQCLMLRRVWFLEVGRQLLLRMPQVMEHVLQGRGRPVDLSVWLLLETAVDRGCVYGCA